jgi:hypothetical protein
MDRDDILNLFVVTNLPSRLGHFPGSRIRWAASSDEPSF